MNFFFKDVEEIVNPDTSEEVKNKFKFWLKNKGILAIIIMTYLLGSIAIDHLLDIYLASKYPTAITFSLFGLVFIAGIMQIRMFFLYKKIQKTNIFLENFLMMILIVAAFLYVAFIFT